MQSRRQCVNEQTTYHTLRFIVCGGEGFRALTNTVACSNTAMELPSTRTFPMGTGSHFFDLVSIS